MIQHVEDAISTGMLFRKPGFFESSFVENLLSAEHSRIIPVNLFSMITIMQEMSQVA